MVRLFNIKRNQDSISCDYEPENSNQIGHVIIDNTTCDVKDVDFPDYEYGKKMYVSHVRSALENALNSKKPFPEEIICNWY